MIYLIVCLFQFLINDILWTLTSTYIPCHRLPQTKIKCHQIQLCQIVLKANTASVTHFSWVLLSFRFWLSYFLIYGLVNSIFENFKEDNIYELSVLFFF